MASPGGEVSTDSSDSSSSAESTSTDSNPAQATSSMSEIQVPRIMENTDTIDHDDMDSDISMSADSDDEDEVVINNGSISVEADQHIRREPQIPVTHSSSRNIRTPSEEPSKKRKFSGSEDALNGFSTDSPLEFRKRLKPDPALLRHRSLDGLLQRDRSLLPAEIWHHIFTFCAPRVLGNLLQVNKSFNAYLDPSSSDSSYEPLSVSATQFLLPVTIWRASRSIYNLPSMPNPLLGKSELDMWKLACGSKCQFCGKKRQANSTPIDQYHSGPGENGVVPIWSFEIRTCGPCLLKKTTKEIDLLLSTSIPSLLLAALPFIFLTNELHIIPATTLQAGQAPPGVQISKHFYNPQIDDIKQKFENVKALGSATAEEWLKGLDGQGLERKADSARWERWDVQGGVTRMRNLEAIEAASRLLRAASARTAATSLATNGIHQSYPANNSLPKPPHPPNSSAPQLPNSIHGIISNAGPPRYGSPVQNGFASYNPRQTQFPKHERTKEEVAELKLARKAEIERRCMLLNPPITAAVLAHMPSFQAAIQIIQPVTDSAWEVLEPRLLSQRGEAEQRENDRLAQTRVAQEQDLARSNSRDLMDREWDDFQSPLRARIGGYADEVIRDGWNGGEKVSYETAPRFAADVLIYVRKRFYAEVAKDDAAIRATGREPEVDPPNGPFTRKLVLENMKWIFDTKVKPYTEHHRKELFLCNACEYPSKYYGFEGVIQHYAAKHTTSLSSGSVVVHWKSEWPEFPPFNYPEPSNNTMASYFPPPPAASVPYTSAPMQSSYGYGGYQATPVASHAQGLNSHGYQENVGSYYGSSQYGDQYAANQNGYNGPPVYQEPSTGYSAPQYSGPPPQSNGNGYVDPNQGYGQQSYNQYPGAQGMYASPHPAPLYPSTSADPSGQQGQYGPQVASDYNSAYNQAAAYPPSTLPLNPPAHTPANNAQPPRRSEEYTAQLQELAKTARNIWNSIGNVKEVPGSLKVYTIIHHVLQTFRDIFQEEPSLSMMVDGLSNNKDMRPVRNVNGLVCKACSLGMIGSAPTPQKKHFSFPQLVNHFHSMHEQGVPQDTIGYIPDWTKDMVELPHISKLTSIVHAPGLDDQKLRLFTDAVPEIISVPEPQPEKHSNGFNDHYEDRAGPAAYTELAPSQDNHNKYYAPTDRGRPADPKDTEQDSGEYDPHNPGNISLEQPPVYKVLRNGRRSGEFARDEDYPQRHHRYEEEPHRIVYPAEPERVYVERRPSSQYGNPGPGYERVVFREDAPIYLDRQPRYHDAGEIEYRVRPESSVHRYTASDIAPSTREFGASNTRAYQSNQDEMEQPEPYSGRQRPVDVATQQNSIVDVVAQISHHAQEAKERQPRQEEIVEAGSEDGEVRAESGAETVVPRPAELDEASTAADRFLNEFRPGEATPNHKVEPEHRRDDPARLSWGPERNGSAGDRAYQPQVETQRSVREYDEDAQGYHTTTRRIINPADEGKYVVQERAPIPRPSRTYTYDDRYVSSVPEQLVRDRSPELVDRRYKLNNVVYREERQGSSNGTRRTPSRYARYESVRLENDRARSRSPVYVKVGPQSGTYRERELSPGPPPIRQEPVYRSRTPQQAGEEITYERPPPRPEYYRVYTDESRRVPHHVEPAYEIVRVADPAGDYMIRRPVRREPEPIYYEDEVYARQPVYESRPPLPRPERAEPVYEEYDPRQPTHSVAPVRQQIRYL